MDELIPLELLEAFVEVARRGSVTKAAQTLHRSQPAISHRIKRLEEHLGAPLFEKAGRGLKPTALGERLYREARGVLVELRDLPVKVTEWDATPRGKVTIGTFPTMARHYLLDPYARAMGTWPEVKWVLETGLSIGLMDGLHSGRIDTLYLIGALDADGLEVDELGEVEMRVVFAPGSWRGQGPPSVDFLRAQRLLLWPGGLDPSFQLVEAHARSLGVVDRHTPEVPHIETLRELARRGLGWAILPDYVITEDVAAGRLESWPVPGFAYTFPIRRYHLPAHHRSAAVRAFDDLVTQIGRGVMDH